MTRTTSAHNLQVPGARLHYEVRGDGPLVALIGSPMDATAFAPVAELLATDHTVLTADPRGSNRSTVDDPHEDSRPKTRADDLSRLLAEVATGPAAVFGSSGGATTVLALAQAHPEQLHTLVAHEPPLRELLEEREELRARADAMVATFRAGDRVAAWREFLAIAGITLPEEVFQEMFGGERDPQRAADEYFGFVHEMPFSADWRPDLATLRASAVRILLGIGEDSAGQLCDRTSRALAAEVGVYPVMFPGGHTGFLEDPERFAERLRELFAG